MYSTGQFHLTGGKEFDTLLLIKVGTCPTKHIFKINQLNTANEMKNKKIAIICGIVGVIFIGAFLGENEDNSQKSAALHKKLLSADVTQRDFIIILPHELAKYFGKQNLENLDDDIELVIDKERYRSTHYADGTRRDKPLYSNDEIYARGLRYVLNKQFDMEGPDVPKFRDLTRINQTIDECKSQLRYAHPSEVPAIQQKLQQAESMRRAWLATYDERVTFVMSALFAGGAANEPLTQAINAGYALRNADNGNDEQLNYAVNHLSELYIAQKKVAEKIPLEAQLLNIDLYEQDLSSRYNYQSSPKTQAVRNRIRAELQQQIQAGK